MTIGIIILCVAILLMFFGLAERFFRKLGVANWLAFLLVLALVVGAIIPNVRIGNLIVINISGFLIPIAIMVLFQVLIGFGSELFRALLAQISVAALTITVRLVMPDNTAAMIISGSFIIGFLGGAAAYLVSRSRMGIIVGTMGGIAIADVGVGFIGKFVYDREIISLGTGGVFNSMIMAVLFGLLMYETINALIRANSKRRLNITTLSFEAGEDLHSGGASYGGKKRNAQSKFIDESRSSSDTSGRLNFEEYGEYNDYFDDKLL